MTHHTILTDLIREFPNQMNPTPEMQDIVRAAENFMIDMEIAKHNAEFWYNQISMNEGAMQ